MGFIPQHFNCWRISGVEFSWNAPWTHEQWTIRIIDRLIYSPLDQNNFFAKFGCEIL